jgi:hypothetical protein
MYVDSLLKVNFVSNVVERSLQRLFAFRIKAT